VGIEIGYHKLGIVSRAELRFPC